MKITDMIPWRKNELARPNEELRSWVESMDRGLEDLWSPFGLRLPSLLKGGPRASDVRMEQTPKEIVVSAKLPGMDKEDIRVDVTENAVTIRAERKAEEKGRRHGAKGWTRSYASFTRAFSLPVPVKAGGAKASYKNGVLRLVLPKVKETEVHRVAIS